MGLFQRQASTLWAGAAHFTSLTAHEFPKSVNPGIQAAALQTHSGAPVWRQHVQLAAAQLPPGAPLDGPHIQLLFELVVHPIQLHMHAPFDGYEGSAQQIMLPGSIPTAAGEQAAVFPAPFALHVHVP